MSTNASPFQLLASDVRRDILFGLVESESLSLPEDIPGPRARDGGDGGVANPVHLAACRDERELAVELYHVHLPKLAACDVVEWDPEAGVVTRGEAFDDLRDMLELLSRHEEYIPDGL